MKWKVVRKITMLSFVLVMLRQKTTNLLSSSRLNILAIGRKQPLRLSATNHVSGTGSLVPFYSPFFLNWRLFLWCVCVHPPCFHRPKPPSWFRGIQLTWPHFAIACFHSLFCAPSFWSFFPFVSFHHFILYFFPSSGCIDVPWRVNSYWHKANWNKSS